MSDKVTKRDLVSSFRKLNNGNLITLDVICEKLILQCENDENFKYLMFDCDYDYCEFLSFVQLFKRYLFQEWPIAYLIGVHVDEK